MEEGQQKKYSVSAIVPKTDKAQLKLINTAIEHAKANGKDSKFAGKIPPNLKLPLHDGDVDRPDDDAYKGAMFFNARNATRPAVVDRNRQAIIDQDEIASGDYGYLNVTFYPYNAGGSKGIGVSFNHIMKTKTGERLSSRISVDDAFENVEIEDDDASSLM